MLLSSVKFGFGIRCNQNLHNFAVWTRMYVADGSSWDLATHISKLYRSALKIKASCIVVKSRILFGAAEWFLYFWGEQKPALFGLYRKLKLLLLNIFSCFGLEDCHPPGHMWAIHKMVFPEIH